MISKTIGDIGNTNHDIIFSIQGLSNSSPEIIVKGGLRVRINTMHSLGVASMLGVSRAWYKIKPWPVGREERNGRATLASQPDKSPSA